jgi:tripartite-type tricarboxylate transporter receptor subunit TctC
MNALRAACCLLCAALCAPLIAFAQHANYPSKPIRVVVPFVAGGGTDLLARLITPRISALLGQQIVVDNRGGAGSIVGTQILAKAAADGYTLGILDTAFAINPAFADKLPYDAHNDFAFLAIIATSPTLLVTHPGLKVRTIQELVALAKKYPRKVRFASAGVGSASHLSSEMLKTAAGIDFIHVPFKGAGQAIIDVLGSHTDLTFVVPGTVKQHIQAGTVQNQIIATLATVMKAAELQARLIENDFDPSAFLPPPQARGYVENEMRKWQRAVKDSGAKP